MTKTLLEIQSPGDRKYTHGAAIVSGVVRYLRTAFNDVTDFKLRMHRPMYGSPTIEFTPHAQEVRGEATGSITLNGSTVYFSLEDTSTPFIPYVLDEDPIEKRIEGPKHHRWYILSDPLDVENPFVLWNSINKYLNLGTFSPTREGKMWLTGIELNNLNFLSNKLVSVASAESHRLLSPKCIRREIFYNAYPVGVSTSVYVA